MVTSSTVGLEVPVKKDYITTPLHQNLLQYVNSFTRKGNNINVLVTGAQGTGKSELVTQFAAQTKRKLAVFEIGLITEADQIFGTVNLVAGATVYIPSLFMRAIEEPHTVVHLQEFNRLDNDKVLNSVFSVLDPAQREIEISDIQRKVKVAPGVIFFASMNEGYEFTGTTTLDAALEDRFSVRLNLTDPPAQFVKDLVISRLAQLKLAMRGNDLDRLVKMFTEVNSNVQDETRMSVRLVLEVAQMVASDVPMGDALSAVFPGDKLEILLQSNHFSGGEAFERSSRTTFKFLDIGG